MPRQRLTFGNKTDPFYRNFFRKKAPWLFVVGWRKRNFWVAAKRCCYLRRLLFGVIHPSIMIFGVQFYTKVRGRGFLLRFPKCTYFDWKISYTCVLYFTKLGHKKNKSNFWWALNGLLQGYFRSDSNTLKTFWFIIVLTEI